jgi:cytosine/adenosine deaminase-related metal-dependent hydrolase
MSTIDILIENGTVVTMDQERRILPGSSVAVAGGKIVDIGPAQEMRARYQAAKSIDARRKAIMPGLVDMHSHAGTALIKGIGQHLPGGPWRNLQDFIGNHSSLEWWYVESLLSALEKLKSGTTCSLYMLGCAPRGDNPEYALKSAEGVEKVGIRSTIGVGPSRPPWPREYTYWENGRRIDRMVTLEESLEKTAEAIETWQGRKSEKVRLWVSVSRLLNPNPADPVWDESQLIYVRPQAEGVRRIMEKYGVGFHIHAYGTAVKYLDEQGLGLLGPRTVLAHCWPLDVENVEILARTDTRVAHCPRARRVYGFKGRCPVPEMIDAGVIVGLGSDICGSDRSCSIWDDMFVAPRWQRILLDNPHLIPPGKALEMATIDGARALGLDDKIGSVEVGKDADLIVVNLFKPHTVPFFMETFRLAQFAKAEDVETVMVQGQILMEDRQVKTVNETEVLEWAQQQAEHTIKLFGLEPLLEPSTKYWGHSRD